MATPAPRGLRGPHFISHVTVSSFQSSSEESGRDSEQVGLRLETGANYDGVRSGLR